jgi:hypothetical protein
VVLSWLVRLLFVQLLLMLVKLLLMRQHFGGDRSRGPHPAEVSWIHRSHSLLLMLLHVHLVQLPLLLVVPCDSGGLRSGMIRRRRFTVVTTGGINTSVVSPLYSSLTHPLTATASGSAAVRCPRQ